ncbi:signal peptidase II [Wenxinia marina]|uniref:Lipoprotein signal peptidase n=1 Tax=Wenxinia marina DSM 24838 TaxID=1123501 RepID=A0A0D0PHH5_9RHOB|nr:signal peptidase II [Wenxinia marina]KIQ70811.1 lipoprotein signal peptidase [Wenxinia marina DSM 24838]GGL57126.1 lipoprotein signal peptidase [Wenxinia marina]
MRLTLWTAFWVFLADQATKYLVVHALNLMERQAIDVVPPLLNFRMAWNRGVNFGLFGEADMRWVLVAVAVTVSALVLTWVWRGDGGKWMHVSAGLLVGGAIGNVVDRILYGAVADFLNMSCCGIENPYAFNVADIAVFFGALGLVVFPGDGKDGAKRPKRRKT